MPVWCRMSVVILRSFAVHLPSVPSMPGSFCGPTTISATSATTITSVKEIPNTRQR